MSWVLQCWEFGIYAWKISTFQLYYSFTASFHQSKMENKKTSVTAYVPAYFGLGQHHAKFPEPIIGYKST
jgi:hypothetical protein